MGINNPRRRLFYLNLIESALVESVAHDVLSTQTVESHTTTVESILEDSCSLPVQA